MSSIYQAHSTKGLLLNANESSHAPNSEIMDEFARLLAASSLNRYPDDDAFELRKAFGKVYGLDPAQVFTGNGSDALLQLMITTYCRDGKTLVMLDPDFGMYRFYAGCMQAQTCTFKTAWDGSFDLEEFANFAKSCNAGLVLLSNPNNPTGHLLTRDEMRRLAGLLGDSIVLAADEAYMNFDDESLLADNLPDNMIVTATLSKAWGAAGMRCGFLYASFDRIEEMRPYKIVYSVSTLDQLGARAVLSRPEIMKKQVADIQQERKRIQKHLQEMDAIQTGDFHANFYQIRPSEAALNMNEMLEAFEDANIAVRSYPDQSRIRITVGTREENDRVLSVLENLQAKAAAKRGERHA